MSTSQHHPFSRRRDGQPPTVADTERLLARRELHPGAPAMQHALAGLLDYAAGPASPQELAGEAAAISAFRRVAGERTARSARPRAVSWRGRAIAAGMAAAVVVAFSGAAAADVLPTPVQDLVHAAFGAPAPRHPAPTPKATFPSARPTPTAGPAPSARAHPTSRPGKANKAAGKAKGKAKATGTATATATGKAKAKGKATPPGHQKG